MNRFGRWILYVLGAGFALVLAVVAYGILAPVGKSGNEKDPGLTEQSKRSLESLPYCDVAEEYGVPVEVLAGVVLAEQQLNLDFVDVVHDDLFKVMLWLFGSTRWDGWWDAWADKSLTMAAQDAAERLSRPEWSPSVKATGITFSIGPAQITSRTALIACEQVASQSAVCSGSTRQLLEAMMSPEKSLEVAATVLKAEQQNQLRLTGHDVTGSPGKWATLYNFGGDIFRSIFADQLDRGPNAFGRWVDHNTAEIRSITACSAK